MDPSTSDTLMDILKDYLQKFQQGRCDRKDAHSVVLKVVNMSLVDIENKASSDKISVTLDFLQHITELEHSLFFDIDDLDETPALSKLDIQSQQEQDSYAFTIWFLSHLLRLLPEEGMTDEVRNKIYSLITNILQSIKPKSLYIFGKLMFELIGCLAELSMNFERFFDEDQADYILQLAKFNCSSLPQSQKALEEYIHHPIVLREPEACERLQVSISQLLKKNVLDVCQYCMSTPLYYCDKSSQPNLLWAVITTQLENGEVPLKTVSLELAEKLLLGTANLPRADVTEHFTVCLVALAGVLASGHDECQGDYEILEAKLASCLDTFIVIVQEPGNRDHVGNLDILLRELQKCITTHGLTKLRNEKLKTTLCCSIVDLSKLVPSDAVRNHIESDVRRKLADTLIKELGTECNSQHCVTLLQFCIGKEIVEEKFEASDGDSSMELDEVAYDNNMRKVLKLQYTQTQSHPESCYAYDFSEHSPLIMSGTPNDLEDLSKKSLTLAQLLEILKSSLISLPREYGDIQDSCDELEKIRVVVEVIVWSCATKNGDLSKWIQMDTFRKLPESFNTFLSILITKNKDDIDSGNVSSIIHRIASIYGALLLLQDRTSYPTELYVDMVGILSMHWIPNEVTWSDFKPTDARELANIAACIGEKIDEDVLGECVSILALIPKDYGGAWRVQVFKAALCDTRASLREGAIRNFAHLLYHMGPNSNHLMYDPLCEIVKEEKNQKVLECLAEVVGPLTCVVSRKAALKQATIVVQDKLAWQCVKIACTSCDNLEGQSDSGYSNRPKLVDPNMFTAFLKLLKHNDEKIKIKFVGSLERMFGHIVVRSNNSTTCEMLKDCMGLLTDENYGVRIAFSKQFHKILTHYSKEAEIGKEITLGMKEALKSAQARNELAIGETVLFTAGEIARNSKDRLFKSICVILLEQLCLGSSLMKALAQTQLTETARSMDISMKKLFRTYANDFCMMLASHLHTLQGEHQDSEETTAMLEEVTESFGFENTRSFLDEMMSTILPYILVKMSHEASAIIRAIAAAYYTSLTHKQIIVNNLRHIYCHLVLNHPTQEIDKILKYIANDTQVKKHMLMKAGSDIDIELIMHLGQQYDKVVDGLNYLKVCTLESYRGKHSMEISDLVETLQCKLLGILLCVDKKLNSSEATIIEKKQTYESLVAIMKLMGPVNVTSVRRRIISILRKGQQQYAQDFPDLCCQAWNIFVKSVDFSCLGSMLTQIAVSLQPLLKHRAKEVAEILHYLIVENRRVLEPNFHELDFIPEMPELKDVNRVIKSKTSKRNQSLVTKMELLVKGISHESMDVRQVALSKLRSLLHKNQSELHRVLVSGERVHPVVANVINVLLSGCKVSNPAIRDLYGECLGELGAIDPGRLETLSGAADDVRNFRPLISDNRLAPNVVQELVKAYLRSSDRATEECCSFSLQTLIQYYRIEDSPTSASPGAKIFREFDEETQDVLKPLMNSKYTLKFKVDWSTLDKPIYQSKKGSTFSDWIKTFTGYLISKVAGQAQEILGACSGTVKHEHHIAYYLLPYVVTHVLLDGTDRDREEIKQEILAVLNHVRKEEKRHGGVSDLRYMAAQTIFSLLDHLTNFTRHIVTTVARQARQAALQARSRTLAVDIKVEDNQGYVIVKKFLNEIPQDLLAAASTNCSAYSRALRHLEQYIRSTGALQSQLDSLQKLYVALDEPDAVAGVESMNECQPKLEQQIRAYEITGQLSGAFVCYDKIIIQEPNELTHRQGLLACRLSLGEISTAMEHCNGIISERPDWTSVLNEYRVEASWKLGQWEHLENYLKNEDHSKNWNIGLGKALLAVKQGDRKTFSDQVQLLRSLQMAPLSAASLEMGSYYRGYDYIIRLHMLNELERGVETFFGIPSISSRFNQSPQDEKPATQEELHEQWDTRLNFVQASYKTREPILSLRRAILNHALDEKKGKLERDIGQCWLTTAKLARESGLLQTAHSSLISASNYRLPEFEIENAEWLKERGDYEKAMSSLEKALEIHFPGRLRGLTQDSGSDLSPNKKIACSKMMLLLGMYREETSSWESNDIVKQYKTVTNLNNQWEDGFFHLARYYDKVMTNIIENERPHKKAEFIYQVVHHFGLSLKFGNQYIYQSMPRMLALWLDYGSEVTEAVKANANKSTQSKEALTLEAMRTFLQKLNKLMGDLSEKLSAYQFLTAFPQLISRICHSQDEVFTVLMAIIGRLLKDYPQQSIWQMMAVSKSTYQVRANRCKNIFSTTATNNKKLIQFLSDATKLTEKLLDLCNKPVEGHGTTLSISQHFTSLKRLINEKNFSNILIPLQSLMTVTLPPGEGKPKDHDPFPNTEVYIQGIEDTVEVLSSLAKPKKITLQGSDGRLYTMMCKPKDDLRKDARLMEFNSIVNKCLRKDPEARRRDLHIRTYTVTPLNEECGLLEWVNNTMPLRQILLNFYKERGIMTTGKELRQWSLPNNTPIEKKLEVFKNKLLPRHPAVFSEWFLKTFPDPSSWYNARNSYCRTSAVMCMVGYILGLGDRHGENILFDSTNGDCVHVDFNCLFNKGETFDYPEVVPFRLTHNLIDAMGPLKWEGVFRKSCEVTMRVMRNECDPLMSVLKTFIYDPLVEWSKPAKGRSNPTESGEIKNEQASGHVSNIDLRINGIIKNKTKRRGLPLSVQGQVNHLIKEATDEANLASMYIGWAAYM